jgi:hypothetical protein
MLTELVCSRTINRPDNPGNELKIFQIVDHLLYCSGAKEQYKLLETLSANISSHKNLFARGDPNLVKYAISFLDTLNNHPDTTK